MLKNVYTHVSLLVFLAIASCSKVETDRSRQEEMRGGKWQITSGSVRIDPFVGKDTIFDYKNYLSILGLSCKDDDYLVFQENYDGAQYSNTKKCSLYDPESVSFRWQLFDDESGVYFLNATETFLAQPTIKAAFVNYSVGNFTVRYVRYDQSQMDATKYDTLTFTQTFAKF